MQLNQSPTLQADSLPAELHRKPMINLENVLKSRDITLPPKIHLVNSWVRKIHWRRDRLPTPVFLGFSGAQLVKNLPTMWEIWIRSLGWEDPLEKGKAPQSSIPAKRKAQKEVHVGSGEARALDSWFQVLFVTLQLKPKYTKVQNWVTSASLQGLHAHIQIALHFKVRIPKTAIEKQTYLFLYCQNNFLFVRLFSHSK